MEKEEGTPDTRPKPTRGNRTTETTTSKLRSIHPDRSASHDSFNLMIEEKISGGSTLKGRFLAVSMKKSKK